MLRMTKISTMIWQASVLLKKNDQETYVTLAIDKNHTLPIIKDSGDIHNENRTETQNETSENDKRYFTLECEFHADSGEQF